jgi:glycosyltransferase involved in cell wall biosynthesis
MDQRTPRATGLLALQDELAAVVKELLPDGAAILDLAEEPPDWTPGEPRHELVLDASGMQGGPVEQVEWLRGLASRSRRYVLVLVPNRLCCWYWLWRVRKTRTAPWPPCREDMQQDVRAAFERAGLQVLGQSYLGAAVTEERLGELGGMEEGLLQDLLAVQHSPLLPAAQKCFWVAILGTVGPVPDELPPRWQTRPDEDGRITALSAALADALALRVSAEAELHQARANYRTLAEEHARIRNENTQYRDLTASAEWRLAQQLGRLRRALFPRDSLRFQLFRACAGAVKAVAALPGKVRPARPAPAELSSVLRRARVSHRPIIFLPTLRWTATLFQRPHHLSRELARLGHLVIFDCTGTTEPLDGFREVEKGLLLYKGESRHLARLPDAVLWASTTNYHLVDGYPPETFCVYDWIDDLAVFPGDPGQLLHNHRRALQEADLVACVSRPLLEEARQARPDAIYLPNAAEPERFLHPVAPPSDPRFEELRQSGRPLTGYYGALASWFDYSLLQAVAGRRPDWNFVLIGPDIDRSTREQALWQCPNVVWLGPRDYQTLPAYLARFDVALIPFTINAITRATSPLKLYEYFSAGKPVVTTPMPECQAHPEVHVARWADEFAAALDAALAQSRCPQFRQHLRAIGRANSWAARACQAAKHFAGQPRASQRAA